MTKKPYKTTYIHCCIIGENRLLVSSVFGGGRLSDTGRASSQSETSRISQPTLRPDKTRGFGKSLSLDRGNSLIVVSDRHRAFASDGRSRQRGIIPSPFYQIVAQHQQLWPGQWCVVVYDSRLDCCLTNCMCKRVTLGHQPIILVL